MTAIKNKGPIIDPGLCRCCGSLRKCRLLNVEYVCFGEKEIYSDMVVECFGLLLTHLDGKVTDRLICATCVQRLREAVSFRQQVIKCEEIFINAKSIGTDCRDKIIDNVSLPPSPDMKVKMEPEDDVDNVDTLGPISPDPSPPDSCIKMEMPMDDSNSDDVPLKRMVEGSVRTTNEPDSRSRIPDKQTMLKLQQCMRERDFLYMSEVNVSTMVEYSFIIPFKCRHNYLLCYYCGQFFTDPKILRDHTLTAHNPKKFRMLGHSRMLKIDLTRIDCRLCSEKIDSLERFKQHITMVHNKKLYPSVKDMLLPFKFTKDDIKCALCEATFPYFHALNRHMNEHYSNFVCETCGLGFVDKRRLIMHQQRHENSDFPCEVCGKIFKATYNRDLHVDRVHNKKGRVNCPKCDVMLMTYPQKLKHLVEVHGEAPLSFPCNMCDKILATRRMLTIHKRKDHLKDFRYECHCCHQKFFTRFALNNHMPVHTGERNFKCKVCGKSYPRLKTLKYHIRIHTNDRRYRCHICGQAFIQNCSLKGHLKSQHPEYS